jgi:hypothetical protein
MGNKTENNNSTIKARPVSAQLPPTQRATKSSMPPRPSTSVSTAAKMRKNNNQQQFVLNIKVNSFEFFI